MTIKSISRLIALNFIVVASQANAAIVLEHRASILLGAEYHSNLALLEKGKESLWLYTVIPEYEISALDDKNKWFASAGLRVERSTNQTISENREDPTLKIGWERLLEKGMASVVAEYKEFSSRTTQFEETGVVAQDATQTNKSIAGNFSHSLTDKLKLILGASYEKNTFSGTADLNDYSLKTLETNLAYNLSEALVPYINLSINDYRTENAIDNQIKYQNLLAGANIQINPQFSINVGAGVSHVSSKGDNEAIGLLSAIYMGEKYILSGSLERSIFPTAAGEIDLGDRFSLNYKYDLSEDSKFGVDLGLSQNNSAFSNETQELIVFYDRNLSTSWLMRTSLSMRNLKQEDTNSANSNAVGITFTYNTPKF